MGSTQRARPVSRKLAIGSFLGAAALVLTTLAVADTAEAADCPSGALCAYTSTYESGSRGAVYADNTDLTGLSQFRGAESLWNAGTSCNVRVYSERNYTGHYWTLARGTGMYSLNDVANNPEWGTALYHHVYSNNWCV
ncbi:peptidase inhibitor family I36 protein [Streptomyces shenzhenensis]|uniref:peptidase inhibitor family I36 protein n=1 Tax=Streptomyces shenzhenensis TaxID=943815 RepID=UPI001F244AC0|nr:peptidase inhibitor family I36 protein [Streptomyces shenzhenensis]